MSGLNHNHLSHSRCRCELGKVCRFRVFRRRFRRLRRLSPVREGGRGGGGLCLNFSSLLSIYFYFTIHSQTTPFRLTQGFGFGDRGTNQPSYGYIFQNLSNQNLLNPSYAGDEKLASYPEPPAKMMMYLKQASYATGSYSEVLSGGSFSPHKYADSDGGRNEMMLLASSK
ncbi:hypothetical protein PRUPE_1G230100 [Prunus persica]|uniref:Uncharacterized protein n=2 Tax=Prunus persica TaxID=3760 RepID=A0A251R247_PRUPE|nr:uncharacterized protein LOC109946633 isoform X2 [Prunus persica]ONI30083.1 hypothetical protein PRUPE_1G230100 [Prunus persica]